MMHSRPATLDNRIVIFGDSLAEASAGGVIYANQWPVRLSTALQRPVYNAAIGGETIQQIAARYLLYSGRQILILVAGRNSVLSVAAATMVSQMQSAIAHCSTERYLVFDILPLTNGTEDPGDSNRDLVDAANAAYYSAWSALHIIKWSDMFDVSDNSLRSDGVHPTSAAQQSIWPFVHQRIVDNGW